MITTSLIILAILAYLGRSLVMLFSVGGMAIALWLAGTKPVRLQLLALLLGGVGASVTAEVIHLAHHVLVADDPDHGGFWLSAFLVGLINVAAMLPAVSWVWFRGARRASVPLLLFATLGLGACGGDDRPAEGTFELGDSAGVMIVQNRGSVWDSAQAWQLSQEPRLQLGLGGDEAETFFQIRRVRLRSDGGVAVLEGSSAEVRVFGPSGRSVMVFGGDGDGPGELRGPRELFVLSGDTITAWDNRPSQSVFSPTGDFLGRQAVAVTTIREHLPDRMTIGYRGLPDGSVLAVGYAPPRDLVGHVRNMMLYTRATIDGARLDTLGVALDREWWVPTSGRGRGRTLLGPESHSTGGARSRIALGESAVSAVHVYSAEGLLEFLSRFPDEGRSVPSGALEAARVDRREVPMPSANLERFLADAPEPAVLPAFGGLLFDRLNHLWILPYLPDEGAAAWGRAPVARILDPEGRMLGAVQLPQRFRVHDVGADRIAGVRVDDLDVEIVEVYGLSRSR